MKSKIYGEFAVTTGSPFPFQGADRILGGRLEYDFAGKPASITLQYELLEQVYELRVKFGDAMFLLSLLKAVQLDEKIPFPDDPRGQR